MKKKLFLMILSLIIMVQICASQEVPVWDKWSWLIGEWIGEGEGQPGVGTGTFSFSFDLDKNILIRRSHSEYPATSTRLKTIHDDLMVIYPDADGAPVHAVYFDNERHTIFYSVTFSDDSIILTSGKSTDQPIFRLVYERLDSETINTKFEMAQDGINFMTYVEGRSKKMLSGPDTLKN
jgi:hypothetical protein